MVERRLRLLGVGLGSILYFVFVALASAAKPVWYDEIFTLTIARLPRVADIWSALARGTDLNPPLSYLAVRASSALLGPTPFAARLPSAVGFWLMAVCLAWFVGRRCGMAYGWAAAVFPFTTSALFFATEARPYGLVLGGSGFALVCWQAATDGKCRPLASAGLALGLAAAVSSHYYAVLILIPLAAGELVRTWGRKRLDPGVIAALAAGLAPLVVFRPLLASARQYVSGFWGRPAWTSIPFCYVELLSTVLPALVVLLVLATLMRPAQPGCEADEEGIPRHESTAALGFALLPAVGVLLAKLVTGAFAERYVVGAVIGLSILTTMLAHRLARGRPAAGFVLAAVFSLGFLMNQGPDLLRKARAAPSDPAAAVFLDRLGPDGPPVLIANSRLYLQAVDRVPPDRAARLVYIGPKDFTDTIGLRLLGRYRSLTVVDDLDHVLARHPRLYVIQEKDNPWSGWLLPELAKRGAQIMLIESRGSGQLLEIDRGWNHDRDQ